MLKILVVDDDPSCLYYLAMYLREAGHEVVTYQVAADAVAKGPAFCPDVLIADLLLDPSCNGIDVALALRAVLPKLEVILVTGLPALASKNLLGLTGAKILEKPLLLRPLIEKILSHLASLGPRG